MKVTFFSGTASTSTVEAPQIIAVGLADAEKAQLLSEINEQATALIEPRHHPRNRFRKFTFRLLKIITFAYELRFRRSLYPRVGKIKIYNFHLDSVG